MKTPAAAAVTFALLTAPGALAAGENCIRIENDLDRLACYDKALGRTPVETTEPAATADNWTVSTRVSKLTDDTNVIVFTESRETIDCGWNKGDKVALMLLCVENTTQWLFFTGCHMADHNDYDRIEYRLDKDNAKSVAGRVSTDNKYLGLWRGSRAIPVIKQMFGKSEMVARMTPFSESPFTATFNIAGLQEAIAPLRKECGW